MVLAVENRNLWWISIRTHTYASHCFAICSCGIPMNNRFVLLNLRSRVVASQQLSKCHVCYGTKHPIVFVWFHGIAKKNVFFRSFCVAAMIPILSVRQFLATTCATLNGLRSVKWHKICTLQTLAHRKTEIDRYRFNETNTEITAIGFSWILNFFSQTLPNLSTCGQILHIQMKWEKLLLFMVHFRFEWIGRKPDPIEWKHQT